VSPGVSTGLRIKTSALRSGGIPKGPPPESISDAHDCSPTMRSFGASRGPLYWLPSGLSRVL